MKILLCCNLDIYCLAALNFIHKNWQKYQVKIYFSKNIGSNSKQGLENDYLKMLKNYETNLSVDNIKNIAEQSEVLIDWENFLTLADIQKNYQIFDFENINNDGQQYLETIWQPDLIVSVRFGKIFKQPIINLPNLGVINLHSGILPNYRGVLASFWSMLRDEKNIGTAVHFIKDYSIDTGDIIKISTQPANYQKPLITNIFKLYPEGLKDLTLAVQSLEKTGRVDVVKQEQNQGQYFSYPGNEEIEKFIDRNLIFVPQVMPNLICSN